MTGPASTDTDSGMAEMRRSALEEERDLLLRSLDDLEAERAAGDLDRDDYESLRDAYTARAADVLRELAGEGAEPAQAASAPASTSTTSAPATRVPTTPSRRRSRRLVTVGLLLAFAVVAGFVLARAAGERGVNDAMTGGIDPSSRTQVLECQDLGSAGGDLVGALQCFDDLLAIDPENAEALTYRGWYLLLAAGSLQQTAEDAVEEADAEALIANGLGYLDRAIAADSDLPDPLAFRAVIHDRLGRSEEACADVAVLRALEPPAMFLDLTADLASRNGC